MLRAVQQCNLPERGVMDVFIFSLPVAVVIALYLMPEQTIRSSTSPDVAAQHESHALPSLH